MAHPKQVLQSLDAQLGARALGAVVADALLDCDEAGALNELKTVALSNWRTQDPTPELSEELEQALARDSADAADWSLIGGATALALAARIEEDPTSAQTSLGLATRCAPHTPLPLLPFLFDLLDDDAQQTLATVCAERLGAQDVPRAERVALAGLLVDCPPRARDVALSKINAFGADPAIRTLISDTTSISAAAANLQLTGTGMRRVWWCRWLWAVTGVLLLCSVVRAFRRYLLRETTNATVVLQRSGLEISQTRTRFGKQEQVGRQFLPKAGIASITLEQRFAGVSSSAGLLCLALGTLIGVSWVSDGLRVQGGSPSLLVAGIAAVALGVFLDFGLTRLSELRGDRCALLIQAGRRQFRIGGLDPERASAFLRTAKERY